MGHNVFMIKGIKTYISKTELIRYSKHFKFDDICSHINEIQFTPSYRDIGESKRALRVRINEHKNKKNSEFVVCEHQLEFNHEFDWENTKIVDYVSDYRKRLTSEIIYIKFNKFSIN